MQLTLRPRRAMLRWSEFEAGGSVMGSVAASANRRGGRAGASRLTPIPGASAWTLLELMVSLSVLALLAGMLVPTLSRARRQARLAVCAGGMHGVGVALRQFASAHDNQLPPFAFSAHVGNLALSGHWGGQSQPADPDCFGRRGVENVNLWRLVAEEMLVGEQLVCPGAHPAVRARQVSYFPYSLKFSTYCLRMPYSRDVFRAAPELADWAGVGLLGVYTQAAGGVRFPYRDVTATVPLVRTDLPYWEVDPADGTGRAVDLAAGALVSDTYCFQDRRSQGVDSPALTVYPVRAGWCHGSRFNVLFGDGAVAAVDDGGVVSAQAVPPGGSPPADEAAAASAAIRVWRHFEDRAPGAR